MTQDEIKTETLVQETPQEETVGALLRRTRLEQKQDLHDIATFLCIRYQFLNALEEERYKELPDDAYASGFIRSYAAHLGLNPADIITRYKQEYLNRTKRENELYVMSPQEAENIVPAPKVLLISLVLFAAAFGIWQTLSKNTEEPLPVVENTIDPITVVEQSYPLPEEKPSPVETKKEEKIQPSAPVPPVKPEYVEEKPVHQEPAVAETHSAEAPATAVEAGQTNPVEQEPEQPKIYGQRNYNPRLVLVATEESWIEVTRSDTVVFSRLLKPGDQYWVSSLNPEELFLKTGNAGGLEIYCDGKLTKSLGESGTLRSNVALIPEDFAAEVVEDIE